MKHDDDFYPDDFHLLVEHELETPIMRLLDAYELPIKRFGTVVAWSVEGMEEEVSGTFADLRAGLESRGLFDCEYARVVFDDDTGLSLVKYPQFKRWRVEGKLKAYSERVPTGDWIRRLADLARGVIGSAGFTQAKIERRLNAYGNFVPQPPLARDYHLITTTEAEIADNYADPELFLRLHRVEKVGDTLVCSRALDAATEYEWLGHTFEDTMALARAAKPGKTFYSSNPKWRDDFDTWWTFGDYYYEKGGPRALTLVGYDPGTRTLEYTGYCIGDRRRNEPDLPATHVHVKEIHELRALVKARKDEQGRPVDVVRIVFPYEAMARRERRPLLDAGARVFYTDPSTGGLVEVAD
jgi:hypothetical protein